MESTTKLEALANLVQLLHKKFNRHLVHWIVEFDPPHVAKNSAKLRFYKYLCSTTEPSIVGARKALKQYQGNIYTIQDRLYERMLEFLILQVHLKI